MKKSLIALSIMSVFAVQAYAQTVASPDQRLPRDNPVSTSVARDNAVQHDVNKDHKAVHKDGMHKKHPRSNDANRVHHERLKAERTGPKSREQVKRETRRAEERGTVVKPGETGLVSKDINPNTGGQRPFK